MYNIGDTVRLSYPVRGYSVFTLVERDQNKWIGECSSGMLVAFYEDEILEKV